jgi:predicted Zn-dependent protease
VLRALSAVGGVAALVSIYETGEHGGALVYSYAGGVGIRSGDPADLTNLLVAGLYHNARVARDSGRFEEAARLTEELALARPSDPVVQLLAAESKLRDRKDAEGALAALSAMQVAPDDPRLAPRHGMLTAQALVETGRADSARVLLTSLATRFPNNRALKDALGKLPAP